MKLSERQQHMLVFIQDYYQEHLYPPTIREIGKSVGISSTSVVNYNLNVLEKQGHIARDKTISRGIKLVAETPEVPPVETVRIPVLGRIAAGVPMPVPGSKLASKLPSELSRAMPFRVAPLTLVKVPPIRILPSSCSTSASTSPG